MTDKNRRDPDIEKLLVGFKVRLTEIMADMIHEGYDPVVFEAFRSQTRQDYLYTLGRRGRPGERKVTWTRNSKHTQRTAADIISAKHGWQDKRFFDALAWLARKHGCRTLNNDRCHVELVERRV